MTNFKSAIAAAVAASPMACGSVPITRNRILLVDGDGLAYYCAGKEGTAAGVARQNLIHKVQSAARIVGASGVRLLLTGAGSNKGHRYAIARVKPYQGQRTNSQRPANWQYLRDIMEDGNVPFDVESTVTAEADDLFGKYGYLAPDEVVHYTQDKDMRMIPGWHLDWVSHRMHYVDHVRWGHVVSVDSVANDLQYGPKWFWLQMLQGDGADFIPGLPKYKTTNAKGVLTFKQMGEKTAAGFLQDGDTYHKVVASLYSGYYGERWLAEMMEQACLLWMRRVPDKWDDCMDPGGPLAPFNDGSDEFAKAYLEIKKRVTDADTINATAQAEDNGDSQDAG